MESAQDTTPLAVDHRNPGLQLEEPEAHSYSTLDAPLKDLQIAERVALDDRTKARPKAKPELKVLVRHQDPDGDWRSATVVSNEAMLEYMWE